MMTPLMLLVLLACGGTPEAPAPSPRWPLWSTLADPADALLSAPKLAAELERPTGRVRVVNFWATWCRPCVIELPELRAFAAAHPEVEVVLVNVDMPATRAGGRIGAILAKVELTGLGNVLLDEADPAAALLTHIPAWPDSIPVTLVIGPDGKRIQQLNSATTREHLTAIISGAR